MKSSCCVSSEENVKSLVVGEDVKSLMVVDDSKRREGDRHKLRDGDVYKLLVS